MPALYSVAVGAYHLAVRIAAGWNSKAKAWVKGREGLWDRLAAKRNELRGGLWMHCASVGEFEQGRPVLEAIKAQRPELPVLLTFFSPSGYEERRDYALATHVDYLPADSAANAQRLVELITPRVAIFVKYEFWYHHLHALKAAAVPTFLVSAIFRESQPFFRWYGGAWREMLGCYAHIFTQDETSRALLEGIDVTKVTVSGDTRFDRVAAIAEAGEQLPTASIFAAGEDPVLVCGSTWPKDESLILGAVNGSKTRVRIIIAPHELKAAHLKSIEQGFPQPLTRWSANEAMDPALSAARTLLVDRMGLLARLYAHGDIAYVGGGFGDGVHSLLEAAAWGKPVIFGPKHTKFAEAQGLIDAGGGFEVNNTEELRALLERLFDDPVELASAAEAAGDFVRKRVGATGRTVDVILVRII